MSTAAGVPKSDWSLPTRPGLQIEDVSAVSVLKCWTRFIGGAAVCKDDRVRRYRYSYTELSKPFFVG